MANSQKGKRSRFVVEILKEKLMSDKTKVIKIGDEKHPCSSKNIKSEQEEIEKSFLDNHELVVKVHLRHQKALIRVLDLLNEAEDKDEAVYPLEIAEIIEEALNPKGSL